MADDFDTLMRQLRRQIDVNKETWLNVIDRTLAPVEGHRLTALDVGCGPGLVMELLASRLDIIGVDRSAVMARLCNERGYTIVRGRGQQLPFPDDSFDVVYCSFVLTWVADPATFMKEMLRVSRRWVICLAESDAASRIDHPATLRPLTDCIHESIRKVGGNITMGRDLRAIFWDLGYRCTVGVSSGVHGDDMGEWMRDEWPWVEETLSGQPHDPPIESVRSELFKCIDDGTAFTFTPIFNAVVDKTKDRRIG